MVLCPDGASPPCTGLVSISTELHTGVSFKKWPQTSLAHHANASIQSTAVSRKTLELCHSLSHQPTHSYLPQGRALRSFLVVIFSPSDPSYSFRSFFFFFFFPRVRQDMGWGEQGVPRTPMSSLTTNHGGFIWGFYFSSWPEVLTS